MCNGLNMAGAFNETLAIIPKLILQQLSVVIRVHIIENWSVYAAGDGKLMFKYVREY